MINGALVCVLVFLALMIGGTVGGWAVWPTAEKHGWRRGYMEGRKRADREQPALPKAGRLAVDGHSTYAHAAFSGAVDPPWHFAGESAPGWGSESAEYELLTQTATLPASSVEGEPPIDTGELLAITDRVESWIAQWTAQGNIDRHTIQAGD